MFDHPVFYILPLFVSLIQEYILKYKAGVYAFVYGRLGSFQDAQDVTQEVFVAYRRLRGLRRWESFAFSGKNEAGEPVASGIYFYRLEAGDFRQTRKMTVLR